MKNKLSIVLLPALLSVSLFACKPIDEEYVQRVKSIIPLNTKNAVVYDTDNKITAEHHYSRFSDMLFYTVLHINSDEVLYVLVNIPRYKVSVEDTVIGASKLNKEKSYRLEGFGSVRYLTKDGKLFYVKPTIVED